MKIIHIMADGSTRESVAGLVVQNEGFYRVVNGIIEKRNKEKRTTIHKEGKKR